MQRTNRLLTAALLALALLLGAAALAVPARAAEPWAGSGRSEDPYLIATAEDLAALASSVNTGSTHTLEWFRLTADIEVSDWTPIGRDSSHTFAGIFDGDGHTVTIENVDTANGMTTCFGLFGFVSGGTVMNTTAEGSIAVSTDSASYLYAGGIAGRLDSNGEAQPGRILNCVNRAEISMITSYAYPYTYAGGIVGQVNAKFSVLMNCYNAGAVASSRNAGGIVGYANSGSYGYCYSAVVPTVGKDGYTGGFSGGKSYGTSTECYAANTWTDAIDGASWLDGAGAQSVTIGSRAVSGAGFWRLGADARPEPVVCDHTPDDAGIVIAPTCTEKGYTSHTCAHCGKAYKTDEKQPLGHDYETVTVPAGCTADGSETKTCARCGDVIETTLPALGHALAPAPEKTADGWTHRCERCDADVLIPRETRHGAMDLVGVSAEITDPAKYPWSYNAETGELESTNCKQGGTSSRMTLTLRSDKLFTLQFTYGVWSEPGDRLYVWLDEELVVDGAAGIIQGADRWDETIKPIELSAGEHVLTAEYRKDSYYVSGADTGYLYGIKAKIVCDHDWAAGGVTAPTCTADGYTTYTCTFCGDVKRADAVPALGHDDAVTGTRATCTADGVITRTCTRCGRVLTETEPALGHEKGALLDETDATWTCRCTRCGESYTIDKVWDGSYTEPARDETGAYLIGSASELAWLHRYAVLTGKEEAAAFSAADVKLTADIYMSGYDWVPLCFTPEAKTFYFSGVAYYSGGQYTGTFDGQGHTIHGLEIRWDEAPTVVNRMYSFGLFGHLGSGEVRDLGLEADFKLLNQDSYNSSDNWLNVGGIAGFAQSGGTIARCFVDADIAVTMKSGSSMRLDPAVGGIVGAMSLGTRIADCRSTGKLSAEGSGYVTIGGIVGNTRASSSVAGANVITRCWSDAALTASPRSTVSASYIGGIVGKVDTISTGDLPEISYCFALNPALTGNGEEKVCAGRVVGYAERFGNEGSYNFALTSMQIVSAAQTPYDETDSGYRSGWGRDLAPEAAVLAETYTNVLWNFDEETEEETAVWTFPSGEYPRLAWESAETPAGFAVTLVNAAGAETGFVSGIYAGRVRFSVSHNAACAVLMRCGGEWTALTPERTGEGYAFTLRVAADTELRIVLRGDLDGNGTVNSADSAAAKRIAAGLDAATAEQLLNLGTERITALTALRIQRAAAELFSFDW